MYDDITYLINGGTFSVYNALGNIWPEEVYENALVLELRQRGLVVDQQQTFEVFYLGKRVGSYRMDVLVNDTVIVELKAVPELLPLHHAQLLSYLKGADKPIGILANLGGASVEHATLPNHLNHKYPLTDRFDYDKITLAAKADIKDLLFMANRVLITLGPGYLAQIYRRALFYELRAGGVEFETVKQVTATYQNQPVGSRAVNFFKIGDLLVSVLAGQSLDDLLVLRFRKYFPHLHCRRGILFNFCATVLDFRYIEG